MPVLTPSHGRPPPKSERARAFRVLVVDDDADAAAALADAITGLGHRVQQVASGLEALAIHAATPVDVIVADLFMPSMSGVDLCRRVRASAGARYVYFVLISGYGDKARSLEGMRAGADAFLTKPLDIDELEARFVSATRVISMQEALSEQNAALARESDVSFKAARIDPLTESWNRLRLREDLDALEARASRYGHRYSAALCDIDRFKEYNDTYGHLAGDSALRLVAGAISGALRQGDTLYRYGGEEFLVVLPEQGVDDARSVMNRVRDEVEGLSIAHRASEVGVLTISVGIAEREATDAGCDEWLRRADAALYRAKAGGRNRVEVDDERVERAAINTPAWDPHAHVR